jgi:hypothetical protein
VGIKIANINVSKIIKREIGDNTLKDPAHVVVLISFTGGARTGNNTGGKNRTSTNHTAKGFIDSTDIKSVKGTLVEDGDVIIQLVGDSIQNSAVPKVQDRITIEDATYRIKSLDRDPAAAMYTCLCKAV